MHMRKMENLRFVSISWMIYLTILCQISAASYVDTTHSYSVCSLAKRTFQAVRSSNALSGTEKGHAIVFELNPFLSNHNTMALGLKVIQYSAVFLHGLCPYHCADECELDTEVCLRIQSLGICRKSCSVHVYLQASQQQLCSRHWKYGKRKRWRKRGKRGGRRSTVYHHIPAIISQTRKSVQHRPARRGKLIKLPAQSSTKSYQRASQSSSKDHQGRYPHVKIGHWNARSMNNKTIAICDLILDSDLDMLIVTESWLRGDFRDNHIIADISTTLPNYQVLHVHRQSRGGGICVIYRTGLKITTNDAHDFVTFELMDLSIRTSPSVVFRMCAIYRPPPSAKTNIPLKGLSVTFVRCLNQ